MLVWSEMVKSRALPSFLYFWPIKARTFVSMTVSKASIGSSVFVTT